MKHFVYILKSLKKPQELYVGYTLNLKNRLVAHNTGKSTHTAKYLPWEIIFYCVFKSEILAREFEKYLKTSSGRAFRNKRLLSKK